MLQQNGKEKGLFLDKRLEQNLNDNINKFLDHYNNDRRVKITLLNK